jgi:hypothetical protein
MLQDVARLSHPEFNGRQTGTPDDRRSALWVATNFHSLGLLPAGTDALGPGNELWAQTGPVFTVQIGDKTVLDLPVGAGSGQSQVGRDYLPILDSPSVSLSAPIVFVGYGISDPTRGFDEYAEVDVRNRIVLFLRGKPERYPQPVAQADKERIARGKGSVAFLTLQGPVLSAYEVRRGSSPAPVASYALSSEDERPLPGCWISTEAGELLLSNDGRSLREVQERINTTLKPHSFAGGSVARLEWESRRHRLCWKTPSLSAPTAIISDARLDSFLPEPMTMLRVRPSFWKSRGHWHHQGCDSNDRFSSSHSAERNRTFWVPDFTYAGQSGHWLAPSP